MYLTTTASPAALQSSMSAARKEQLGRIVLEKTGSTLVLQIYIEVCINVACNRRAASIGHVIGVVDNVDDTARAAVVKYARLVAGGAIQGVRRAAAFFGPASYLLQFRVR